MSSSGRNATKESPEVGAKGASSSGPICKPSLPRRGSDPALPVSLNKTAPPNKIAHSGNGGGGNGNPDESKSPSVKLRNDQSAGIITASSGGISSNIATEKASHAKKPSCKSRHHQHHHHQHSIVPTSVTARAVLAPSCPSAIENSLAGRSRMHQGKRDDSLSAVSAISSTLDVGGALVDPGAPGVGTSRISSGSECGKEFLQHRDSGSGACGTYPSSGVPSTTAPSHHHHHHHHHHHSSGASRRTKNRSKRKKSSKISSTSSVGHSGTLTSDNPVSVGNTGEPSAKKQEDNKRGSDDFKPLEGKVVAKPHPKPHHQHSTSSLLSSSVRVPSALLSGSMAAQSIDSGSMAAVAPVQGRKGSANTVSIPSAAAAMAAGMVPPSLAQPSAKIIEQSQMSHTSQVSCPAPTITDSTHATSHTSGQHHHHRHHHHSHVHSHSADGHKATVTTESISMNMASTTTHFPGTSSKCTQTKLEDEEDTLIPTSPTLARQSPMLVGGTSGTEETLNTSVMSISGSCTNAKSKMSLEEGSGNISMRISHHSHTKTTTTKHQGTSLPSQGHFISKTEPMLSSEQGLSKVPAAHSPNQKISLQSSRTEELKITAHGEVVRDKNSKTRSADEFGKERGSTQQFQEHLEVSRGSRLKSGDSGPGPPTDQFVEGKEDNQQIVKTAGDKSKPIGGKEALLEEGACSVPLKGDKTTADTSKTPQDGGGAESSTTTQTTWESSTEVCPWEDE